VKRLFRADPSPLLAIAVRFDLRAVLSSFLCVAGRGADDGLR